jgi:FAD/FMN-containing dehydrogenase
MAWEKGGFWRNWVGNQYCVSQFRAAPQSEDDLREIVREAGPRDLPVRVVGSGHSFTPVVGTSGLLLSLAELGGVRRIDTANKQIEVAAGARINEVGRVLKQNGLSLINQGDIDSQAVAGAFTTGTHGTGLKLGCLATSIAGMRIAAKHRHFGFFWPDAAEPASLLPARPLRRLQDEQDRRRLRDEDDGRHRRGADAGGVREDRLFLGRISHRICAEFRGTRIHGSRRARQGRGARADADQTHRLHLPHRIPFHRGRRGLHQPLLQTRQHIALRIRRPGMDYWPYLRDVDAILRRNNSRPHWGKMHFLDGADVSALYPRAADFRALRRELDPTGRFLNEHVGMLLG